VISEVARVDAAAFLERVLRLNPTAAVRLRPVGEDATEMWAMLPFGVLVTRAVPGRGPGDVTVEASALLAYLDGAVAGEPVRRDAAWHWSIPSRYGHVVESIPAAEIRRVAAAASRTLRSAVRHGVGGRVAGERAVRDALLDHVPIVVTGEHGERLDIPQRLVQAVVKMGFLRPSRPTETTAEATVGDTAVAVRFASGWIGLVATYGSAWFKPHFTVSLS
jgi:hypothetical protein